MSERTNEEREQRYQELKKIMKEQNPERKMLEIMNSGLPLVERMRLDEEQMKICREWNMEEAHHVVQEINQKWALRSLKRRARKLGIPLEESKRLFEAGCIFCGEKDFDFLRIHKRGDNHWVACIRTACSSRWPMEI